MRQVDGVTGMNIEDARHNGIDGGNLVLYAQTTGTALINTVDDFLAERHINGAYRPKKDSFAIRGDFILLNDISGVKLAPVTV